MAGVSQNFSRPSGDAQGSDGLARRLSAQTFTLAEFLAREGFEPNGDLIFVAAADEEVGVDFGCSWLCREHPEAVRAEYALSDTLDLTVGQGLRISVVIRATGEVRAVAQPSCGSGSPPAPSMMALMSLKSVLISPGVVMMSETPSTAWRRTSSRRSVSTRRAGDRSMSPRS